MYTPHIRFCDPTADVTQRLARDTVAGKGCLGLLGLALGDTDCSRV